MVILSPETERLILTMMPRFAEWLRGKKKITDADLRTFFKLYPDMFDFAKNATYEEVMAFNKKYRDHKIYGKHLKEFLTPAGREYIEYIIKRAKEFSLEQD